MNRLFAIALVSLSASTLSAQSFLPPTAKPLLTTQLRGGFGGVSTDQFYQSRVQFAADQLLASLASVRAEILRTPAPAALHTELVKLSDLAVREAQALRLLASRTSDRRQLLLADQRLDATMDAFLARLGQAIIPPESLADAIARAQFADQQLHAALGCHEGQAGIEQLLRTSSSLGDQVAQLRLLARERIDPRVYTPQLDREVRRFGFRVETFRRNVEANRNINVALSDFQLAATQWQQLAPSLSDLARDVPLRVQIARVENLFQLLGSQLQTGGAPLPILPGGPGVGMLSRGLFACGAGQGGGPRVCVFNQVGGLPVFDFFAYAPEFRGGVRIAVADLNGDGVPDLITAPGAPLPGTVGLPPLVRVFDGRNLSLMSEFLAYDRNWTGGVFVAAADLSRQGRAIIVTGADVGAGPHVRAFDLVSGREIASFFAYDPAYRGGCRVALGDVDGDGLADIVTSPGPEHIPQIRVFSGANGRPLADWLAYDRDHTVGGWVATADVTKDGRADVIVGPDCNGCGVVRVFDALRGRKIGEVSPFPSKFRGGVRVAAHDVNNDGILDIVCSPGPDVVAPVRVFDGRNSKPLVEFLPFERTFAGGAFIGAR